MPNVCTVLRKYQIQPGEGRLIWEYPERRGGGVDEIDPGMEATQLLRRHRRRLALYRLLTSRRFYILLFKTPMPQCILSSV